MTVEIVCDTGLNACTDVRNLHPDYDWMECWNCGHRERVGPNRRMRICSNCFMDNQPTDHDGSSVVEGPDGDLYVDYRLVWYGDVSVEEARERYEQNTAERIERRRARNRVVKV